MKIIDAEKKTEWTFFVFTIIAGIVSLINSSFFGLVLLLLVLDFFYLLVNYRIRPVLFSVFVSIFIVVILFYNYYGKWLILSTLAVPLIMNNEILTGNKIEDMKNMVFPNFKSMIFERDHFILNHNFVQPLVIEQWPKNLNYGFLREVLSSDRSVNVTIHFEYFNDPQILKILEIERETLEAELESMKKYTSSRYMRLTKKLESAQALQNYIVSGSGHVFDTTLTLYSTGRNYKIMRKTSEELKLILQKQIFKIDAAIFRQKQEFFSLTGAKSIGSVKIQTHAISAIFPFLTDLVIMKNGIFYGINDQNQTPVIFNRWDYPSSHMLVSGTTGFGKSYFVKLQILREYMHDPKTRIYIIDPMNEFAPLANALEGTVVTVGTSVINPLDLNGDSVKDKISRLKLLFSTLFELTKNELIDIDIALTELYNSAKTPIMQDLVGILFQKNPELGKLFETFNAGSLKYLNHKTDVNLDTDVTVFNIKDVNEDMLSFYMLLILEYLYGQISRDFEKKHIVLDEAWKLMSNKQSSKFLEQMIRHVRRWKCAITLISQKADDFMLSEEGVAIAQNSMIHVLFKHNAISKPMQEFYKFNDKEEKYILTSNKPAVEGFAKAYMMAGNLKVPLRIYGTNAENKIVTTNPNDLKTQN